MNTSHIGTVEKWDPGMFPCGFAGMTYQGEEEPKDE